MRQRDTATFHDTAEEMTNSSALKHVAACVPYIFPFLPFPRTFAPLFKLFSDHMVFDVPFDPNSTLNARSGPAQNSSCQATFGCPNWNLRDALTDANCFLLLPWIYCTQVHVPVVHVCTRTSAVCTSICTRTVSLYAYSIFIFVYTRYQGTW